jgi:two-component system sensor kinase FixL
MAAVAIRLTRWKRIFPGRISGLLAASLGLFLITAVVLAFNLGRLRESFGWVEHTNEVLRNISLLERDVLEAESGERGFLLTGERAYLDSYERSSAEIPDTLQLLRNKISDNPVQSRRLEGLR